VLALSLALGSSLCWGFSDFVAGLQARRSPLLRVMLVSQGAALAVLCVVVVARGQGPPDVARLLPAAAAGLGGAIALSAFYRALAIGTMSIVAPISATGAAVPVIVGIATGDRPAAIQLLGVVAAIVGVVLAGREPGEAVERRAARASVGLALVAAIGFGAFFVGLRSSARTDVLWALLAARAAGVLGLAVAVTVSGRSRELVSGGRRGLAILVGVGLLDLGANALFALASRHGLLSVVAVGASLYPLVTVALARAILGERIARVQEVGIVSALAGVALIAAG
jgi:drug/metabolite transporter (DMT)-like permease